MNKTPRIIIRFGRLLLVTGMMIAILNGLAYADTTATIVGRIKDSVSGKYIGNARITIVGTNLHAYSGRADGFYKIDNIPPGTYTLVASRGRYQTYSKERITIPKSSLIFIDFALKPDSGRVRGIAVESSVATHEGGGDFPQLKYHGTVKGIVTDALTGLPVSGGRVIVDSVGISTKINPKDGSFIISEVPIGKYSLRVECIGYKRLTIMGVCIENQSINEFNITLSRPELEYFYFSGNDNRKSSIIDNEVNRIARLDSTEISWLPFKSISEVIKYLCE